MYGRKQEPAVSGVMQELVKAETVATLCFLSDVLECTNSLKIFLPTARLNFLDLPFQAKKGTDKLELIKSDPCGNDSSNFARLGSFLEIALSKERAHITRSNREFSKNDFIENVIKPFTSGLIQEINNAFAIPEHLNGFTAFDQ